MTEPGTGSDLQGIQTAARRDGDGDGDGDGDWILNGAKTFITNGILADLVIVESTASAVLYTTAFVFAAPISTTQTITSSILGVGATSGSPPCAGALRAPSRWPGC